MNKMDVIELQVVQNDDFKVEYSAIPAFALVDSHSTINSIQKQAQKGLEEVDSLLAICEQTVNELNTQITRLTNNADGLDYTIAVVSGIISGLIDSFFVGEFSFEKAQDIGKNKVDQFVIKTAQRKGYKGDDLYGAVKYLEEQYPIAADKVTSDFGGGRQHHLRDFSHHPTPVGLFFSLLTQFTKKVYGTDTAGLFKVVNIPESAMMLIGKNLPEKITFGVVNWFFHMVSDMAGSSSSIAEGKYGTGLPGPLVSFLKEVSALPIFRKSSSETGYKEFSVWISKLFNGTLLAKRDENGNIIKPIPFDLRTEIGVVKILEKQAVPVIINECVVRGFYFLRRLINEIKDKRVQSFADLGKINWKNTLPFKNRTIIRMLTISTGTFVAVDMADAAIRSAIKSGGLAPGFIANFVLHINIVGIGRLAVAVFSDVRMGIDSNNKRYELTRVQNQMALLGTAKVFYRQAKIQALIMRSAEIQEKNWLALEHNANKMIELQQQIQGTYKTLLLSYDENRKDLRNIGQMREQIEKNNPGLINDLLDLL